MIPQTFNIKLSELNTFYSQQQQHKKSLLKHDINDIIINLSSNHKISQIKKNSKLNKQSLSSSLSSSNKSIMKNSQKIIINQEDQYENNQQGFVQKEILIDWLNQMIDSYNVKIKMKQSKNKMKKCHNLITENHKITIQSLNEIFPYSKISFTSLISRCQSQKTHSYQPQQTQQQPQSPKHSITDLIKQIILMQILINAIKKQILPSIPLYIPMSQQKLTSEELNEYLLCQNIHAQPENIIKALNGKENNGKFLQYQFKHNNKEQQLLLKDQTEKDYDEQAHQIQSILTRLNNRVDNFGKEWLINNKKPDEQIKNRFV